MRVECSQRNLGLLLFFHVLDAIWVQKHLNHRLEVHNITLQGGNFVLEVVALRISEVELGTKLSDHTLLVSDDFFAFLNEGGLALPGKFLLAGFATSLSLRNFFIGFSKELFHIVEGFNRNFQSLNLLICNVQVLNGLSTLPHERVALILQITPLSIEVGSEISNLSRLGSLESIEALGVFSDFFVVNVQLLGQAILVGFILFTLLVLILSYNLCQLSSVRFQLLVEGVQAVLVVALQSSSLLVGAGVTLIQICLVLFVKSLPLLRICIQF